MSFAEVSLEVFSVWHAGFSGHALGPRPARLAFWRNLPSGFFLLRGQRRWDQTARELRRESREGRRLEGLLRSKPCSAESHGRSGLKQGQ